MQGKGPRYVRVGGRIFYFLHDIDAFIREGLSISEAGRSTPRTVNKKTPDTRWLISDAMYCNPTLKTIVMTTVTLPNQMNHYRLWFGEIAPGSG